MSISFAQLAVQSALAQLQNTSPAEIGKGGLGGIGGIGGHGQQDAGLGVDTQTGGSDFSQLMETIRESMEMALADDFLSMESMAGMDEMDRMAKGGMGGGDMFGPLQMNALQTLSRLGQNEGDPNTGDKTFGSQPAVPQPAQPIDTTESRSPDGQVATATEQAPGTLSRTFESGNDGAAAIGYDRVGGTSYGTYQIASKPGTFERFLDFLDERAPEWASTLRQAGAANTGSTQGGVPDAWRAIAAEDGAGFGALQREFIGRTHYSPVLDTIKQLTGLDESHLPAGVREALFSTSVQHGPSGASQLVEQALASLLGQGESGIGSGNGAGNGAGIPFKDAGANPMNLLGSLLNNSGSGGPFGSFIERLYDLRSGQFGSSTSSVQDAVASRFDKEKAMALAMLDDESLLG